MNACVMFLLFVLGYESQERRKVAFGLMSSALSTKSKAEHSDSDPRALLYSMYSLAALLHLNIQLCCISM